MVYSICKKHAGFLTKNFGNLRSRGKREELDRERKRLHRLTFKQRTLGSKRYLERERCIQFAYLYCSMLTRVSVSISLGVSPALTTLSLVGDHKIILGSDPSLWPSDPDPHFQISYIGTAHRK